VHVPLAISHSTAPKEPRPLFNIPSISTDSVEDTSNTVPTNHYCSLEERRKDKRSTKQPKYYGVYPSSQAYTLLRSRYSHAFSSRPS
jgi:hypothetical protein